MTARIIVASGSRAGEEFALPSGEFVIGADAGCDFVVSDGSVASRQCVITFRGASGHIENSGAATGAVLNGGPFTGRMTMKHGDRVGVGDTELVVMMDADEEPGPPPVYFDEALTPLNAETVNHTNPLLGTILKFAWTIRDQRYNVAAIREKLLASVFTEIPGDRVAILLAEPEGCEFETILSRDRMYPAKSVRISRAVVERVYKGMAPVLSPTLVCVAMDGFARRLGVIYAETSAEGGGFDGRHLDHLHCLASAAAVAIEHASSVQRYDEKVALLEEHLLIQDELVGRSAAMTELRAQIAKVAPTNSTVLIQGESGTGKDLVARAIHRNSKRADGRYVPLNCAAIPETLLESELFGHEKGAFSGATERKEGKLERASGGTLLLDEIAELPLVLQAKLLRFLQEQEFERVGGTKPVKVNIRIIAATNRDLDAAVAGGAFRLDLYHRLKVVTLKTPALRDRQDDIPVLAKHFIARYSQETGRPVRGMSDEAAHSLHRYHWPGNVRELQNAIERAFVMGSADILLPEDFPENILETGNGVPRQGEESFDFVERVNAFKCELLEKAFKRGKGNYKEAAKLLHLYPTYVYNLLQKLNMTHLLNLRE